jgi:biopolymer transport protein TolR
MTSPSRVPLSAEPNVTPMIDVLLGLLIIFMVAIPEGRRAMDVQLTPEQRSEGEHVAPVVLEVQVGPRYAVNKQPIAARELRTHLRTIYRGRPDKSIIVRGVRGVRYQEVINAMDAARSAGVNVVGVDTRP